MQRSGRQKPAGRKRKRNPLTTFRSARSNSCLLFASPTLGTNMAWPSILEKHPEHVHLIGMISIENANLKMELSARRLFIPLRIGRALYLSPQAAHARLDVLRNATKAAFSGRMTESNRDVAARLVVGIK